MAKTKEVKDIMKKARTTSVPGALHAFSSEHVCDGGARWFPR
jgi:hypothetical protein